MDEIYAPIDDRWVTEKIGLKEAFSTYKRDVDSFVSCMGNAEDTMAKIINGNLDKTKAEELAKTCNHEKFSLPSEGSYKVLRNVSAEAGCIELPITEEGKSKLSTLQILSNSRTKYGNEESKAVVLPNKNRRFTSIKHQEIKNANADLKPFHHFLLTVRVYHPFQQNYGSKKKIGPVLAQVVNVLGEQMLTVFRDMIFCVNDYAVPGDRSENLDDNINCTNKEIYPSGFFFIENVFYNDMRERISKDYSQIVLKWLEGLPGKVESVHSASMEKVKFEDLSIRLGYPYVYVHQGSCEHLIVFSDARLVTSADSLLASDYPLLVYLYKKSSILCNFCGHFIALWIVHSCDRVPYRMVHLCRSCLTMYCYKDKKKVGNFFLYEYIDPSSITHSLEQ